MEKIIGLGNLEVTGDPNKSIFHGDIGMQTLLEDIFKKWEMRHVAESQDHKTKSTMGKGAMGEVGVNYNLPSIHSP